VSRLAAPLLAEQLNTTLYGDRRNLTNWNKIACWTVSVKRSFPAIAADVGAHPPTAAREFRGHDTNFHNTCLSGQPDFRIVKSRPVKVFNQLASRGPTRTNATKQRRLIIGLKIFGRVESSASPNRLFFTKASALANT